MPFDRDGAARPGLSAAAVLSLLTGYWCLISAAVMWVYADRYGFAPGFIGLHLALICAGLGALFGLCAIAAALPVGRNFAAGLVVALLACAHGVLLAGYALLFIGWEAWNQPVTVAVVLAYVPQLPQLLRALPVSPALAMGMLALALLAVALPYALTARTLTKAFAGLGTAVRHRFMNWTPAWRAAVLATSVFIAPPLLAHAAWDQRAAGAVINEPLFRAFNDPGKEVGSMRLDAASALRALKDGEAAAAYVPPASFARKTLVVVTVDALRADQMGVYGFNRETTPFLSRLYREGRLTRIERAASVCVESFCGLLAVLNSKYWHQASLRNFGLPEVLKRLGYRINFLLSGDHTHFYGLRDAYGDSVDFYRDGSMAPGYMNDDNNVLAWLEQFEPGDPAHAPQFLFMHLMSVHTLGLRQAPHRKWQPDEVGLRVLSTQELLPAYRNNYHNGVLQADAVIERIFGLLRRKGLLDHAIVVISADHGELLGEQGRLGHARFAPIGALVGIPLLIYDSDGHRYPARPVASQVDIAPTLLHRIGAPIPATWGGEPLDVESQRQFVHLQSGDSYAVEFAQESAIYKYYFDRRARGERLFDVSGDKAESKDLFATAAPELIARARQGLRTAHPEIVFVKP